MRGYVLVRDPRDRAWYLTVYLGGSAVRDQTYTSRTRARIAAWWLRVRGVKPL